MRELTPDLYFLFRKGMTLRTKDAVEIFGTDDLHFRYSGLIWKPHNFGFRGAEYLHMTMPRPIKYDPKRFIEKAPNIYHYAYKVNEKLYAGLLDILDPVDGKSQVYHGLMSGILMYCGSQKGFYYDKEGIRQLKIYEAQEGTE